MISGKRIVVIIPAFNEEESLPKVIEDIPEFVDEIIVVNNASTDSTSEVAEKNGATVLTENEKGYGAACLKAIDYIKENYDLVIGSRMLGKREKSSMLPQAVFGNWLASFLVKLFWNYKFTDLGPFRAIRFSSLQKLNMVDRNFGWTVEMQIKAAKQRMKTIEVPVSYRKRIGQSKVTGTIKGSVKASVKILYLILISVFRD